MYYVTSQRLFSLESSVLVVSVVLHVARWSFVDYAVSTLSQPVNRFTCIAGDRTRGWAHGFSCDLNAMLMICWSGDMPDMPLIEAMVAQLNLSMRPMRIRNMGANIQERGKGFQKG